MQLTANVYVETEFLGANVSYVTTNGGVVMLDTPQRPTDAVAWRKEMESKGAIKYLVNLEPHSDHCNGNFIFTATAVTHEKSREVMLAIDRNEAIKAMAAIDPDGVSLIDKNHFNIPSVIFSERLTLYLGKHSFHLIHMPGHTESQIAAFVPEERVVFTGDNVVYKRLGFLHEADPFAWLESLERLKELDVDYIVPGHGEVCDKSYLKEQAEYIQGCIDAVKKAFDQGWTKDEALARVSWPTPYALDPGSEQMVTRLKQTGISNLYDRLSPK
jgi:cyclase